jgi:nucleoside-diphosphate-sugar epimerase
VNNKNLKEVARKLNFDASLRRVVVIGKNGFVGRSIINRLTKVQTTIIKVGRDDIDLASENATEFLSSIIEDGDVVIFAAGEVPVRSVKQLNRNLTGLENFVESIGSKNLSQLIYISSDAVYIDSSQALTEDSIRGPLNLHGLMHLTREVILQNSIHVNQLCIVRPTLIYGLEDPHNGYGPCSFYRLAKKCNDIVLFGNGEEERDFIHIIDVAEIVVSIIMKRFTGELNLATGKVYSFYEIAYFISELFGGKSKVITTTRNGPMPHNGYRPFDIRKLNSFFPEHQSYSIYDGLALMKNSDLETN